MRRLSIFASDQHHISFEQRQNTNLVANGDDFNIGDLANDLEVHRVPLYLYHTQS